MNITNYLPPLLSVALLLLLTGPAADAQNRTAVPSPRTVSVKSSIAADNRVSAMPVAERVRSHAVPRRGMCSTIPAVSAEDGLFSGNGTMNVSVFGDPFIEQVQFNHEDIVQPWKTGKPMEAPQIAGVLPDVRKLMLQGEYRKALDLSLDASAKAGLPQGTGYPQEHPAVVLRMEALERHDVANYLRTLDFESGEIVVRWSDDKGVWERRSFVSRPDNVVAQF